MHNEMYVYQGSPTAFKTVPSKQILSDSKRSLFDCTLRGRPFSKLRKHKTMVASTDDNVLLPLVEAVQKETGQRVHLSTVLRWAQHGSRGVYLETKMLGGRRMTSRRMVREFIDKKTAIADGPRGKTSNHLSPKGQAKSIQRANQLLDAEGV